jgi:hypothetical protein
MTRPPKCVAGYRRYRGYRLRVAFEAIEAIEAVEAVEAIGRDYNRLWSAWIQSLTSNSNAVIGLLS